jgi:hypothetical protein
MLASAPGVSGRIQFVVPNDGIVNFAIGGNTNLADMLN